MGLRFASLFCGCGGFDLGFINAGFKCEAAFDLDLVAVKTHQRNLDSPAKVFDLSDNSLPESLPTIEVLLAGPPCQGFSTAGKRDLDDPRNQLLLIAANIARKLMPNIFILENVTGVMSGHHKKYWNSVKEMLLTKGYRLLDFICESNKMGVPQIRKRRLIIAWLNNKEIQCDFPHLPGSDLRNALKHVDRIADHNPKFLPVDSQIAKIAKQIKPGQKLSNVRGGPNSVHTWDIPEVFGKVTKRERAILESLMYVRRRRRIRNFGDADPVPASVLASLLGYPVKDTLKTLVKKKYIRKIDGLYDLTHTFNGKFRRLCWDQPSNTVDTRFGNPHYFLHPQEDRGFTVREAARIQGFPDSFEFEGSENIKYRLIGNAVPPPLAKCVADFVRGALLTYS